MAGQSFNLISGFVDEQACASKPKCTLSREEQPNLLLPFKMCDPYLHVLFFSLRYRLWLPRVF